MEIELDDQGNYPAVVGAGSIDHSRTEVIEKALEERLISMLATIEEHVNAEATVDAAKAIGILFGCWRSMQPEIDQTEHPFTILRDALQSDRIRRRGESGPPDEQSEEPDES